MVILYTRYDVVKKNTQALENRITAAAKRCTEIAVFC